MTDAQADAESTPLEQLWDRLVADVGEPRELAATVLLYGGVLCFGFMLGIHYMAFNLQIAYLNSGIAIQALGTAVLPPIERLYYTGMKVGGALALLGLAAGTVLRVWFDW